LNLKVSSGIFSFFLNTPQTHKNEQIGSKRHPKQFGVFLTLFTTLFDTSILGIDKTKALQQTPPPHGLVFLRSSPNLGVCPVFKSTGDTPPRPQKSTAAAPPIFFTEAYGYTKAKHLYWHLLSKALLAPLP
jgi:hypothetical protein